ncbi:peptidase S8/S53 domain-containing protein [Xylariales sp. PMI_506]|nr:peptidase S8/S53 domain-containing protein [Xylariales sp. PMI_506]
MPKLGTNKERDIGIMFVSKLTPAVLALAGSALAFPSFWPAARTTTTSAAIKEFESIAEAPRGWSKVDSTFDKTTYDMELRIQLTMQNIDEFNAHAVDIATPGHPLYGQHMSLAEIDAIVAPKAESAPAVMQWLKDNGLVGKLSTRGNVITAQTTVDKVESLLNTQYDLYKNDEGKNVARTLSWSIPEDLFDHITVIQPTTFFGFKNFRPKVRPYPSNVTELASSVTGCTGEVVDPTCLANLYGFIKDTGSSTSGRMGIAGFIEQWPSKTDLSTFLKKLAISSFGNAAKTFTCVAVNNGKCPSTDPGDEANLDIQYSSSITKEIPNVYYSTGGDSNTLYDPFIEYLLELSASELPNTVSVSYGGDESSVTKAAATNTCNLFAQLGAKGVSVLFAAGDSGVGEECRNSYQPDFPCGCPYVTAVGGLSGNTPEKAWTDGGGGFSDYFTRPTWQADVVETWLSTNKDGKTQYYNTAGRGYPDVSAQAVGFEIVLSGRSELVDGTSCASPTFASVIELVNSQRIAAGKSALGFLNPWLYSTASTAGALTDITSGKIGGCTRLDGGFTAIKGWDPATGLGSPVYEKLLTASSSA